MTTFYQSLRAIRTNDMPYSDMLKLDNTIIATEQAQNIIEVISQYRQGLVTFSEMMNFIIAIEFEQKGAETLQEFHNINNH